MRSYRVSGPTDGMVTVRCPGWPSFASFVQDYKKDMKNFIWRGQRCSDWELESSLDRLTKKMNNTQAMKKRKTLLEKFKFASRGRRLFPPYSLKEDEWWALGQHFGLRTPLLDWTLCPFIAVFFAFWEPEKPESDRRAVFALSVKNIRAKGEILLKNGKYSEEDIIRFISPLTDDNARLIHQHGVFTHSPCGLSIEKWVNRHFKGYTGKNWVLAKVQISDRARNSVLQSLERMAISPLELFPDLTGASQYCNLSLEIKDYSNDLNERDLVY